MKKPLRYDDAVGAFALCREGCCNKKHRAKTERFQNRYLIRLLQLSAAGEVFLEGTCLLSRCPQTAKFSAPCSGARRRWVRKATAFRGRSEQDRSALCPACCTGVLKTFRWNVFNEISFSEIGGTQHIMSCQTIHRCRSLPQLQPNFEKSLTLFQKKAILKCIRVYPDSKRRCAGRGFLFWGSVSWQSNGSNNWKKY